MLIFRQNFSKIIEITTLLQAELMLHNGVYFVRSFAHVLCTVRRVTNLDHNCLKLLQALKYDPSEIIAKYQLALGLPALDHIKYPWTLTDDEEEEEEEEWWWFVDHCINQKATNQLFGMHTSISILRKVLTENFILNHQQHFLLCKYVVCA